MSDHNLNSINLHYFYRFDQLLRRIIPIFSNLIIEVVPFESFNNYSDSKNSIFCENQLV
jgi:hypothetical protein